MDDPAHAAQPLTENSSIITRLRCFPQSGGATGHAGDDGRENLRPQEQVNHDQQQSDDHAAQRWGVNREEKAEANTPLVASDCASTKFALSKRHRHDKNHQLACYLARGHVGLTVPSLTYLPRPEKQRPASNSCAAEPAQTGSRCQWFRKHPPPAGSTSAAE